MCEEGFTEVLTPAGQLDQCAPIPILEIPSAGDKKGDVKTSRAINPTLPTSTLPGRTGRTWYLQPYGPGQTTWPWAFHVYKYSNASCISVSLSLSEALLRLSGRLTESLLASINLSFQLDKSQEKDRVVTVKENILVLSSDALDRTSSGVSP